MIAFVAWLDPAVLFAAHQGPGAFYRLMPQNAMALLFGAVFIYAVLALVMGMRDFWPTLRGRVNHSASLPSGKLRGTRRACAISMAARPAA